MQESPSRIILTNWNAGVFHSSATPRLLPELIIYSLLYDEVLIREEDLITNRVVTGLLSEENNFAIFSEMLISGLVKLLRLPAETYPLGRKYDPLRLPISSRVEEHQLRRTYKGKPWKPTSSQWRLFQRLDEIVVRFPDASRYHTPFPQENPFAAQLGEILENRDSYGFASHPVFSYIDPKTADQFAVFCRDSEAWLRFLHKRGITNPIVGPDAGFYRSAAYQCSAFLPTRRAIRRLVESVYSATYCEREDSDGRYGDSELVELPYRFLSDHERIATTEDLVRVEVVPTNASAAIALQPGIAQVVMRTRESREFEAMRNTMDALGKSPESPLLIESRFREAWNNLCRVHAENLAIHLQSATTADHKVMSYLAFAYVLARVLGFLILSERGAKLDYPVVADAAAIEVIKKLGPKLLSGFRASVKVPVLQERMSASAGIRCSNVPLTLRKETME
jgi:hypothetical protein